MLRRAEAEKAGMQSRLQEVEKETFQHLQETSEKVREMRVQQEAEVEVVKKEKDDLEAKIASLEAELKGVTTKYEDVLNSSSSADVIRERDTLKDKCEKLTNMCKKYLAKVKQQEVALKEKEDGDGGSEAMTLKIQDLESALEAARADCVMENEDLIRELKQKLEAAPEDITVPVDSAAALAEANQAKNELQSLKEKCKKLIVKVKQQDAQLKKIGKDKSADNDAPPLPNNDDAKMKKLMDQVEQLESLMAETRTENERLNEQLLEEGSCAKRTAERMAETNETLMAENAMAMKKAEEKVLNLKKEREEQCGQIVELRTAVQQLEVA